MAITPISFLDGSNIMQYYNFIASFYAISYVYKKLTFEQNDSAPIMERKKQ